MNIKHELLKSIFDTPDDIHYICDPPDEMDDYINGKLNSSEENTTNCSFSDFVYYINEDYKICAFCKPTIEYISNEDGEEHGYSGKMWIYLNQDSLEPINIDTTWNKSW